MLLITEHQPMVNEGGEDGIDTVVNGGHFPRHCNCDGWPDGRTQGWRVVFAGGCHAQTHRLATYETLRMPSIARALTMPDMCLIIDWRENCEDAYVAAGSVRLDRPFQGSRPRVTFCLHHVMCRRLLGIRKFTTLSVASFVTTLRCWMLD